MEPWRPPPRHAGPGHGEPWREGAEAAVEQARRAGLFNPGSPTERRRAPHRTMGVATVADGALRFAHVVLED